MAVVMLLISGCSTKEEVTGDVVEELSDATEEDVVVEENPEVSETEDLEGLSTKEMINKLSEDAGLPVEEESTETSANESSEESETETSATVNEIVIEDLSSSPENLNIKVGDTVKWISNQKNYKHIIIVRSMDDETYKDQVAGPFALLYTDSAEFTFENTGKYDYYSKPCHDSVNGDITVTE